MKTVFFSLLCMCVLNACSIFDREEAIPAFLSISEFNLEVDPFEGSPSSNIKEVQINIDGSIIGIFELPAVVPILEEGTKEVTFSAIIKQNGLSAARVTYPFYQTYTASVDFIPLDTSFINPVINYREDLFFSTTEFTQSIDLEEASNSDGQLALVTGDLAFDDLDSDFPLSSVVMEMDDDGFFFFAQTEEELDLPAGQAVFLELNYACNHPFKIGITASLSSATSSNDLVIVLPSYETTQIWNKIYVNLTDFVGANSAATEFEIYLELNKSSEYPNPELYLDNLKVIY